MLIPEQKACCQQFSEDNLDMLRANSENFFSRIITGNETWVHHHDPETKQESMQCKHKGSPTPKKFCVEQIPVTGKIMAEVSLGLRSCSAFGIHATQENHSLLEIPMLPQWWLYVRISNRNTLESCRLVSCCFMTMHPHTSHSHRGLRRA